MLLLAGKIYSTKNRSKSEKLNNKFSSSSFIFEFFFEFFLFAGFEGGERGKCHCLK